MSPFSVIRPSWPADFSPIWWFFLLISAGAVAITLLAIYASLFGLTRRIQFDSGRQVITHGFKAELFRHREKCHPFSAVETLQVKTHKWTDGPATYNLTLKLKGAREVEFGRFTDQAEAERYLSALGRMVKRRGNG